MIGLKQQEEPGEKKKIHRPEKSFSLKTRTAGDYGSQKRSVQQNKLLAWETWLSAGYFTLHLHVLNSWHLLSWQLLIQSRVRTDCLLEGAAGQKPWPTSLSCNGLFSSWHQIPSAFSPWSVCPHRRYCRHVQDQVLIIAGVSRLLAFHVLPDFSAGTDTAKMSGWKKVPNKPWLALQIKAKGETDEYIYIYIYVHEKTLAHHSQDIQQYKICIIKRPVIRSIALHVWKYGYIWFLSLSLCSRLALTACDWSIHLLSLKM